MRARLCLGLVTGIAIAGCRRSPPTREASPDAGSSVTDASVITTDDAGAPPARRVDLPRPVVDVALVPGGPVLVATTRGALYAWDPRADAPPQLVDAIAADAGDTTPKPLLASGSPRFLVERTSAEPSTPTRLELWDAVRRVKLRDLDPPATLGGGDATRFAVSRDLSRVLYAPCLGEANGDVRCIANVYALADGALSGRVHFPRAALEGYMPAVYLSPTGRFAVIDAVTDDAAIHDVATGRKVHPPVRSSAWTEAKITWLDAARFLTRDGDKTLAVTSLDEDHGKRRTLRIATSDGEKVASSAAAPDASRLAVVAELRGGTELQIWDLANAQAPPSRTPVPRAVCVDGCVATWSADASKVHVHYAEASETVLELDVATSTPRVLARSAAPPRLVWSRDGFRVFEAWPAPSPSPTVPTVPTVLTVETPSGKKLAVGPVRTNANLTPTFAADADRLVIARGPTVTAVLREGTVVELHSPAR